MQGKSVLRRHNDVGSCWQVELGRQLSGVFDGSNYCDGAAAAAQEEIDAFSVYKMP